MAGRLDVVLTYWLSAAINPSAEQIQNLSSLCSRDYLLQGSVPTEIQSFLAVSTVETDLR
jgi:hypothetical protein